MTLTADDIRLLRRALLNYIPPPSDQARSIGLAVKLEQLEEEMERKK